MLKVAIICFFIAVCWLGAVPPVLAADLNAIKSQVKQQVEVRQQQVEAGTRSASEAKFEVKNNEQAASPGETKVIWSLFGGKIKLHRLSGQLYLSLFSWFAEELAARLL